MPCRHIWESPCGTFSPIAGAQLAWLNCTVCASNQIQTQACSPTQDRNCFVCPAGQYPKQGMCVPCAAGIFANTWETKQVYLLRDLHIESLLAGFSGFPGHRRTPHQKLQKFFNLGTVAKLSLSDQCLYLECRRHQLFELCESLPMVATCNSFHRGNCSLALPYGHLVQLGRSY